MLAAIKRFINPKPDGFQQWIKERNKAGMFTPDIYQLGLKQNHHVFVYGNTMEGHEKNGQYMNGATYLGQAFTLRSVYLMWKKNVGSESYPIVLEGERAIDLVTEPGRIVGEVYDLTQSQIIKLDAYMLNTVQFERQRVKVLIPHIKRIKGYGDYKKLGPYIEVWMYVGIRDYWHDLIDAGYNYKLVKNKVACPIWERLDNSFHYSIQEHNDFKVNSKRTVP